MRNREKNDQSITHAAALNNYSNPSTSKDFLTKRVNDDNVESTDAIPELNQLKNPNH